MARKKFPRARRDIVKHVKREKYQTKDNVVLRVATFLNEKGGDGATIYEIIHNRNIGLSSQDQTRFTKVIMEPMAKNGWIKRIVHSKKVVVYRITEKGSSAVSDAFKLHSNGSLLASLESFSDLVS
ncbi:MAG: hypothetical protein IIA83_05655 [Thaumarchaeota archaeon]|nr:hypothetical protein [Nitrososphaerota archaeon]